MGTVGGMPDLGVAAPNEPSWQGSEVGAAGGGGVGDPDAPEGTKGQVGETPDVTSGRLSERPGR
eukprot:15444354-Alexandrium_andersonii.AAC.1